MKDRKIKKIEEKKIKGEEPEFMEGSSSRQVEKEVFTEKLLTWYHANKRTLPWREKPTAYHVWLSEIMLQQTRVEAVKEYYKRFLERLPDIKSLSEVDDEVLHKLWEGLGYYNRAKNLKKAAVLVMQEYDGNLPSTYERLLTLPGIGPYTAGAIASIAFHEAVPAVDGNVMRVIARLTGNFRDITEAFTKKEIEEVVRALLPEEVHHFNQALMELGALVCIPNGKPKCEVCPVKKLCFAFEEEKQGELPVKKGKKARKKEKRTIILFRNERGEFLIRKREEEGLLSGLWEFPTLSGELSAEEIEKRLDERGILYHDLKVLKEAKHIFSHIEWEMRAYLIGIQGRGELSSFFKDKAEDSEMGNSVYYLFEETEKYRLENEKKVKTVWASYQAIKEQYSLPSAFRLFLEQIF